MTNPSDARERIAAICQHLIDGGCEHEVESCREQCDSFAEYCLPCQTDWLLNRVEALEREAAIKDAYAYELAKQRDAAITEASNFREALLQATTPPAFTEEMGSGDT